MVYSFIQLLSVLSSSIISDIRVVHLWSDRSGCSETQPTLVDSQSCPYHGTLTVVLYRIALRDICDHSTTLSHWCNVLKRHSTSMLNSQSQSYNRSTDWVESRDWLWLESINLNVISQPLNDLFVTILALNVPRSLIGPMTQIASVWAGKGERENN